MNIIEGYTALVKIAEAGIKGNTDKARLWMEKFIADNPNHQLCKPFKNLLDGVNGNVILLTPAPPPPPPVSHI